MKKPFAPLPAEAGSLSGLRVELLGRAAYSVRDPVRAHSLGIALERQRGVHAIGSDRRADFDTWPGMLAYTPPRVEVFSESETGGEYLVIRWSSGVDANPRDTAHGRICCTGQSAALRAAHHLRRLLLQAAPDALAIEEAALAFLGIGGEKAVNPGQQERRAYGQVLERIASEFAQPLSITQLAQSVGKTPLRFLREFTQLVGMTPHAFIVETRLQAARAMMKTDHALLAEIAIDCGFTHQSHMGAAFRKVLGQTPGQYLAAARESAGPSTGLRPGRR